jgi:hypothetical protein
VSIKWKDEVRVSYTFSIYKDKRERGIGGEKERWGRKKGKGSETESPVYNEVTVILEENGEQAGGWFDL